MFLQGKNIRDYKKANEVLYVLYSIDSYADKPLSRIGLQKIIYLSVTLSPIKEVILSFLRFQYYYRGPYSSELQNTIDHLVGVNLVKVDSVKHLSQNRLLVDYSISNSGKSAVERLIKYEKEEETFWWINTVCRIALYYSEVEYDSEWNGIDRIVNLVYEDPSFLQAQKKGIKYLIDLSSDNSFTKELIKFTKKYINENFIKVTKDNERNIAEILIMAFLEYYTCNVIINGKQ